MKKYVYPSVQALQVAAHKQSGVTLVELLVAISLGLFLTWGAIEAFLSGKQTYSMQQALSRIQENTRIAQELMGYDVRDAGNYGCAVGRFVANFNDVNRLSGTVPNSGSFNPVAELNFAYAVFATNDVSGAANADTTLLANLNPVPVAATDVLITHNATNVASEVLAGPPLPLPNQFAAPNRGVTTSSILAVSDCTENYIFTPSAVVGGATATITLAAPLPTTPIAGSSVMPLDASIYYIGLNGAGTRSLYRRLIGGNSEELLNGVENLQIEVGVDTNNDGVVDLYTTPNAVTPDQWNAWNDTPGAGDGNILESPNANPPPAPRVEQNVVAIRYSLLMRSNEELLEAPQTYNYNGAAVTAPDRRLYQVVTSTIGIRSRLN